MLRVMAFACQFTVARTLGHNCSYPCVPVGGSGYTQKDWVAQETPCSHLLESRPTAEKLKPSSEEQEILSWFRGEWVANETRSKGVNLRG
jgi:hypothetical protein